MRRIYAIIAIAVSCLVMTTCKKDKEPVPPVFKFNEVEASGNSAKITGEYEYEGELKNLTLLYGKDPQLVDAGKKDVEVDGRLFSVTVDDLESETKYYYGIECKTTYSSIRTETESFMTKKTVSMAEVTTNEVTAVATSTATSGGNVTSDGNASVTAKGICWSTSQNPTISNSHTTDGNGTGSFTSSITGLTANTTYYVRAYATNEKGTSYGEQKSFKTLQNIELPMVTTTNVSNITQTTATSGGNVTSDGGATITARGVCWSTSQNPTISNSHTTDGNGTGSFTSNITGLTANTTYYVRAYATNEKGTSYGEEKSFETSHGVINGYGYVDLGLPSGLKWATCNVGASSPEEYGDYYAWGEKNTKAEYELDTYLHWNDLDGDGSWDNGEVTINSDISGNAQYDAATANWGGSWRMPTKEELEELRYECTWTWTTHNGVNGCKVTGPNGNHIFLPAAGERIGSPLYYAGECGYYWSSSPDESIYNAYIVTFASGTLHMGSGTRYQGYSVRPVSE